MDGERFARLRRVFERAEELPLEGRDAYLREACGDDAALRHEVVRMLAATEAPDFLAPLDQPLDASAPDLPERVGAFEVLGLLGEGGFGVVYRARQGSPVERVVALKVLHPRRLDPASRLRFEAERRTLARMQHGGIAQVYDAGVTADGLHFLAMELVEGHPITDWCDAHRLGIDARLELFLRVCAAVQHAHQRGVVHRDLKPNNVLVKDEDGRAVPKVIDFGVAKLLERESDTEVTADGALVGTPGYMSPEQAAGGAVDTRTDVHALGVLLYDLLTGDLPFSRERLSSVDAVEAARLAREEEPRRMSTAVRDSREGLAVVAGRRGCEGAALVRALRGDLEWIVRKTLAKDPEARYASVSALIADVERLRHDEPVSAREPAALYVARKFISRHRLGVTLGLAALLVLVVGVVGLTWALGEVSSARDLAGEQRDTAVLNEYAARLTAARAALEIGDAAIARGHLERAAPDLRGWEWRHLAARCDGSEAAIDLGSVIAQALWLDERRALVFRHEGADVVDLVDGRVLSSSSPFDPGFDDLALHRASGRLVVDRSRWLELWEHELDDQPQRFFDFVDDVRSMVITPDGRTLYTSENGGLVRCFDLAGERPQRVLCRAAAFAWDLALVADGRRLIMGTTEGRVEVRDTGTGELERTLTLHREDVKVLAVSPDERVLYAAVGDRLQSWDLTTWEPIDETRVEVEIFDLEASPDGRRLYGCGGWMEGRLLAWDAGTLEVISRFHGHQRGVGTLDLRADGARLLSGGADGTLRLWPASAKRPHHVLDAGRDARDLAIAHDGGAFAIVDVRGLLSVWDAHTLLPQLVEETGQALTGCAIGAEEIYVTGERLWAIDRRDGSRREGDALPRGVGRLELDPGEAWLAGRVRGEEGRLMIWKLPELSLMHELDVPDILTMRHARSTGQLLVGSGDGLLRTVDPGSGALLETREVAGPVWDIDALAGQVALADGRLLTCEGSGQPFRPWAGAEAVSAVAFSPDGTRLAIGGTDTLMSLWDRHGSELLVLDGSPKPFVEVGFAAGGERLVGLARLPGSPSYVVVWEAPAEATLGD